MLQTTFDKSDTIMYNNDCEMLFATYKKYERIYQ